MRNVPIKKRVENENQNLSQNRQKIDLTNYLAGVFAFDEGIYLE